MGFVGDGNSHISSKERKSMDGGLRNRAVVVTGGGGGIGLAAVEAFLAEGARVVAADLDPSSAASLAEEDTVVPLTVDLSTPGGPVEAVTTAVERFGAIDVLVNNVGIAPHREGFLDVSDAEWLRVMEINFFSMIRACRATLPHMVDQGHGAIVSVASDAGRVPGAFFVDYCVTKASVLMLSKAIATEFAPHGIRSNCVSPGPTRTSVWEPDAPITRELAAEFGGDADKAIENFLRNVRRMPMARLGEPSDVAAMIVFLASDLARQVTGADYRVDGGQIPVV
jgi:NAD(P)-dependent dehydrogenase (short-subunit alcohol dehydrogenase family)